MGDVLGLMALLEAMYHGDLWRRYEFNHLKVKQSVEHAIQEGFVFVIERDGKLVASAAWIPHELWFSTDMVFSERWFFVRKGYRNTTFAQQLIRAGKDLSDRTGIDLSVSVYTTKQANRKNALFRRHLVPVGEQFIHHPETQEP